MPKIKEAVAHFLLVKMSGNGVQSHLDTQSFAKFDVLWIKQFSIWHPVALKKHWLSIMKVFIIQATLSK
jgi:hypothetical protein